MKAVCNVTALAPVFSEAMTGAYHYAVCPGELTVLEKYNLYFIIV
jgi:hypothetical protein